MIKSSGSLVSGKKDLDFSRWLIIFLMLTKKFGTFEMSLLAAILRSVVEKKSWELVKLRRTRVERKKSTTFGVSLMTYLLTAEGLVCN